MDRERLLEHLHQAERHVRQGVVHIENQKAVVANLKAHGLDTRAARQLLAQFESLQALHIADRNRLRAELGCC